MTPGLEGSVEHRSPAFILCVTGKQSLQSKSYFTFLGFKLKNDFGACSCGLLMSRAVCKCTVKMECIEILVVEIKSFLNTHEFHFFKSLVSCIKLVSFSLKAQNNLLTNLKSPLHNLTSDRLRDERLRNSRVVFSTTFLASLTKLYKETKTDLWTGKCWTISLIENR